MCYHFSRQKKWHSTMSTICFHFQLTVYKIHRQYYSNEIVSNVSIFGYSDFKTIPNDLFNIYTTSIKITLPITFPFRNQMFNTILMIKLFTAATQRFEIGNTFKFVHHRIHIEILAEMDHHSFKQQQSARAVELQL